MALSRRGAAARRRCAREPLAAVDVDHIRLRLAPRGWIPSRRQRGANAICSYRRIDPRAPPVLRTIARFRHGEFQQRFALLIYLTNGNDHPAPTICGAPLRLALQCPFVAKPLDFNEAGKVAGVEHFGLILIAWRTRRNPTLSSQSPGRSNCHYRDRCAAASTATIPPATGFWYPFAIAKPSDLADR